MAGDWMSKWRRLYVAARNFFDEKGVEFDERFLRSRLHRFAHFWLLVGKSFIRNRCHVRASALAYTTLLALVPLLAVGVSITTSMLQKQGAAPINELIDKLVNYVAPALDLETRPPRSDALEMDEEEAAFLGITNADFFLNNTNVISTGQGSGTNMLAGTTGRQRIVNQITGFISRINSGTLGVTSVLALLFVAISLLRTIEAALNDMWGVTRARGWFKSIVYYWAAVTLGPLVLVGALTLTTGSHRGTTLGWLDAYPMLGSLVLNVSPFVILSLGFAAFYAAMPNTRVQFRAALVGGIVGGCLWQLNNFFSVFYVSRVVSYTNLYGSLSIFPIFLVGMYFSWLIMLFGAQVAYAWQNREAYLNEKLAGSVSQRGREFIALRLMTHIAQNFARGGRPFSALELAQQLAVPSQLAQKVLGALATGGLLVEVVDVESRFSPGLPLDRITAYDILCAMRAGQGQELATSEDDARMMVRAEFDRMIVAERDAGASVTLQSLTELAAKQVGGKPRAGEIAEGKSNQ